MPTNVRLTTWNSQGNLLAPAKLAVANALFGGWGVPIAFIQEGGVGLGGQHGNMTLVAGAGVGAFNERCTNYIAVATAWAATSGAQPVILQTKDGSVVIGGGDAGRTAAALQFGDMLFVSWHSTASSNNADTSALIAAIEGNPAYTGAIATIVIGGDFNAAPAAVQALANQGTDRTRGGWTYRYRQVFSSGVATHASGRELDFFLVLSRNPVPGAPTVCLPVAPSDHEPVRLDIAL